MSRILTALCILPILLLNSCMDAEPAEISINATDGGQPLNCTVQLFNAKGVQIQEINTDHGIGYFKQVKPDTYIIKFKDYSNQMYPAVRKATIRPGDSHPINVDVRDTSSNPPEAAQK